MSNKFPEQIESDLKKTFFKVKADQLPLNAKLSFLPLIRFWKNKFEMGDSLFSDAGQQILQEIENTPVLNAPIEDWEDLKEHKGLVKFLLSALMPPATHATQLAYVSSPFNIESIFMTGALERKLEEATLEFSFNEGTCKNFDNMIIKACILILDKVFGYDLSFDLPVVFSLRNKKLDISEYYKSIIDINFVDIVPKKKLEKPGDATIKELLANVDDIELWVNTIQPENYEFQGVVKAQLVDITEEEALSRLRNLLLEKNALVKSGVIREIEQLMRNYFRCPDLHLGITALDYPKEYTVNHKYKIRHDLLADEMESLLGPGLETSIIQNSCETGQLMIIDDLKKWKKKTEIEEKLIARGFRSMILSPLTLDDKIIGILELGATVPDRFNSLDRLRMRTLLPMFSTSLERSRDEIDNLLDSIIRDQYTAIHPSIEWKFIESAYELMNRREQDPYGAQPDPIVFKDVIPLFGQADISGSSTTRNSAIQNDLVRNLELVGDIVSQAREKLSMPILTHYTKKIGTHKERIQKGVNSNDEVQMIEFIRDEVEPLLDMILDADSSYSERIKKYRSLLDPVLGIVYEERKAFEDSVNLINDTISSYLEMKQTEIQKALPHYFEKYKTDGVEFEMYIGQSLMKRGRFHDVHIRNMRIWQLILVCEIARLVRGLENQLPIKLDTTQLVLVHSNPLSIRFRMDEKRFDVDGAYNVRYEIIKKRIDKALIKGSNERLTQPGTVSVIYGQERDKPEYEEYIEFLKENSFILDQVDHVELDKTRGVDGLKAFRLHVDFEPDAHEMDPLQNEIASALQQA